MTFSLKCFWYAFTNKFKKNRQKGDMDFGFAFTYLSKVLRGNT